MGESAWLGCAEIVARRNTSQGAPLAKPGKSKREIIRCLKRYVAREVYRVLISCVARSSPTAAGSGPA
ncbi:MAG TPA: hypothetical protein VE525_12615 [Rubrobacter sp.]|nr:hypothetical protein [Rubrobacter sp.]